MLLAALHFCGQTSRLRWSLLQSTFSFKQLRTSFGAAYLILVCGCALATLFTQLQQQHPISSCCTPSHFVLASCCFTPRLRQASALVHFETRAIPFWVGGHSQSKIAGTHARTHTHTHTHTHTQSSKQATNKECLCFEEALSPSLQCPVDKCSRLVDIAICSLVHGMQLLLLASMVASHHHGSDQQRCAAPSLSLRPHVFLHTHADTLSLSLVLLNSQ